MIKHLWGQRLLGAILMVAGTTIGAAMLALPVSTGLAGFFPSMLLLFFMWALMVYTAFLVLEVTLWMPKESNMVTMAAATLGIPGKWFAWGCYLFLLYALTTAYLAAGGPIVLDLIHAATSFQIPYVLAPLPWLLLFILSVYQGHHSVDRMNRLFMLGMALTYLLLFVYAAPAGSLQNLTQVHFSALWIGIPIAATSFGFHIIIPSLATYLGHNRKALIRAIAIGSLIPFAVYFTWQLLTLSVLPVEGPRGLLEGYVAGSNGAALLSNFLQIPLLTLLTDAFLFFAIVTSFLGVSMSLWDFLCDGFGIQPNTAKNRLVLFGLTFGPPLLATFLNPALFLSALEYAGTFGVVTLLGLLPPIMVYAGRYQKRLADDAFQTPGGKPALILTATIACALLAIELIRQFGLL